MFSFRIVSIDLCYGGTLRSTNVLQTNFYNHFLAIICMASNCCLANGINKLLRLLLLSNEEISAPNLSTDNQYLRINQFNPQMSMLCVELSKRIIQRSTYQLGDRFEIEIKFLD